ncbi:sodium:solute symporter [Actinomadura graeca]|uniref:Sodium:solute symporter n=1 Tax=Actinomadura graeca TaxID=2750812 RepID=A0ABX8R7U9_9ACTN|nr:sodium:solute symporter [Actinomadura graeca]QXJ26047.1 sodium:solute symporter [Actinomadura graeca]
MRDADGVELTIFVFFFAVVTVVGFAAARWRRGQTIMHLDEWGLGGRGFGTFVTWFLLGGDLYSAYTFIAVPAAVFAGGAMGFWAVPYGAIAYPLVFLIGPRLWSVAHRHGYVTAADFVRGRYGSRSLGLAVALTGILAMMPYIALQLVGIQAVLTVMGVSGSGRAKDLPLFLAFALLAAYTFTSGLRAPALIAFVKDAMIYLVIIVAVVYIPTRLGGWDGVFDKAGTALATPNPATGRPAGSLFTTDMTHWAYGTLALGSSLALFIYPHSVTGALAAGRRDVIRRNAALLPAYSLLLGLLALLGYMALAHPGTAAAVRRAGNPQLAVPELFDRLFPSWFAGIAFAAIGVGALVPAAIMSIAASNLFTRNVYSAFIRPGAAPEEETRVSQLVSLLVKLGALVFVLGFDKSLAINLQLLGGIWVVQTFPSIGIGLYTRWLHRWGLLAGWAAGMAYGTITAYGTSSPTQEHFGSPLAGIPLAGHTGYIALTAFVLNMLVAVAATAALRAAGVDAGEDETSEDDYTADADGAPAAPDDPGRPLAGRPA